jgi:hypothetical protein
MLIDTSAWAEDASTTTAPRKHMGTMNFILRINDCQAKTLRKFILSTVKHIKFYFNQVSAESQLPAA